MYINNRLPFSSKYVYVSNIHNIYVYIYITYVYASGSVFERRQRPLSLSPDFKTWLTHSQSHLTYSLCYRDKFHKGLLENLHPSITKNCLETCQLIFFKTISKWALFRFIPRTFKNRWIPLTCSRILIRYPEVIQENAYKLSIVNGDS